MSKSEHHDLDVVVFGPTVKQAGDPRGQDATWTLMPAPVGACSQCARVHEPEFPHDADKLYYKFAFHAEHGRYPTWADAMAHCTPEVQRVAREVLREKGIEV